MLAPSSIDILSPTTSPSKLHPLLIFTLFAVKEPFIFPLTSISSALMSPLISAVSDKFTLLAAMLPSNLHPSMISSFSVILPFNSTSGKRIEFDDGF